MKELFPINKFGGGRHESLSGVGSSLEHTSSLRVELEKLIKQLSIVQIDDCPCGDFNWMSRLLDDLSSQGVEISYRGYDIQPDVIALAKRNHESRSRSFFCGDVRNVQFRERALIVIRDCFIHLSNADVQLALENVSKVKRHSLLLTTTYPARSDNVDIPNGRFRPINLEAPPFSLSSPVRYINENYFSKRFWDKSMGLWMVSALE